MTFTPSFFLAVLAVGGVFLGIWLLLWVIGSVAAWWATLTDDQHHD